MKKLQTNARGWLYKDVAFGGRETQYFTCAHPSTHCLLVLCIGTLLVFIQQSLFLPSWLVAFYSGNPNKFLMTIRFFRSAHTTFKINLMFRGSQLSARTSYRILFCCCCCVPNNLRSSSDQGEEDGAPQGKQIPSQAPTTGAAVFHCDVLPDSSPSRINYRNFRYPCFASSELSRHHSLHTEQPKKRWKMGGQETSSTSSSLPAAAADTTKTYLWSSSVGRLSLDSRGFGAALFSQFLNPPLLRLSCDFQQSD